MEPLTEDAQEAPEALGRLLLFGGCHGNLRATETLLAQAGRMGFSPREMLCTGDVAAYCAEPEETASLVRESGVPVVMGNCEESLSSDSDGCGCGFGEGTACDALSGQWYAYCRERVSAATKAWMAGLPRRIGVSVGGRRLLALHGGLGATNEFVFASSDPRSKAPGLAGSGFDGVLAGHCGLPFAELRGGRLWLNSGALGMPANDGTPRVWYATLEACGEGLMVSIRALSYDHKSAARAMRAAGLDNGYAGCLETGLWPSMDVLPSAERAAAGTPLDELELLWPEPALAEPARVEAPQGA